MSIKPRYLWFAGATALFAALAGFVFWGTWALDVVPVMPDCPTTLPADYVRYYFSRWLSDGRFQPFDLAHFLASSYFWVELNYAIAAYFAMLGFCYFARGLGLGRLSSYGGGILLAFSGYWFSLFSAGHLGWFQWMTYGVFAFGLADRALKKGKLRHWLLLGATVAWSSFHQPDLWLLFTLFTGAYFIFRTFLTPRDREFWRRWLKGCAISAVSFALIIAPGVVTMIENKAMREGQISQSAKQGAGSQQSDDARWEFVTNWSLPFEETREFIVPRGEGDTSCQLVLSVGRAAGTGVKPYTGALGRPMNALNGNYRQHSVYVGFVTCVFFLVGAVSALFIRARRAEIAFFAVAAVLFYLLSLGRNFEALYRIIFMLPIGDSIRCPVKWVHLMEFSAVAVAAFGIERLQAFASKLSGRRFLSTALVAATVAAGAFDLARVNKLYCAPVNVAEARRRNMSSTLTVVQRGDFAKKEIQQMVASRRMLSVANYLGHPDIFVVQVLSPHGRIDLSPRALPLTLGLISLLSTIAVAAVSVRRL